MALKDGEDVKAFGPFNSSATGAMNLKRLATATALPVASPSGNGGAATGVAPDAAWKVTPVRHEFGQQGSTTDLDEACRAFGQYLVANLWALCHN